MASTFNDKNTVIFSTESTRLQLHKVGTGMLAVMVPDWDRQALILERSDIEKVAALCKEVLGKC